MTMKFKEDGCFDLDKSTLYDLRDYYAGELMVSLMNGGRSEFKNTIHEMFLVAIDWEQRYVKRQAAKEQV